MNDKVKLNALGDVRAENDHEMLDNAFYEWQGYRGLVEADDRFVVVGRRGTGKSALTYKLMKDFQAKKDFVITFMPDEEDLIGLRDVAQQFGTKVSRVRAAIKIGWKYALIMEITENLNRYYKTSQLVNSTCLSIKHKEWASYGATPIRRLKRLLNSLIKPNESPEELISELSHRLALEEVQAALTQILPSLNKRLVILIDRLDEGYESDEIGVGIVDGIIYGSDDFRFKLPDVKIVLFLRDNIFREIQVADEDFSRNIENNVLRLHWDKQELFYFVCKRLRSALDVNIENDIKVWDSVTEQQLHGRDGFNRCLQMTLYRPRDILSLLNNAFVSAFKQSRKVLIPTDLTASAKYISDSRLDDLRKEYLKVFPGLDFLTKAFFGKNSKLSVQQVNEIIAGVTAREDIDAQTIQHLRIYDSPNEIINALYSVGFLGLSDSSSGNFIFCHDGRKPDKSFSSTDFILIHPCYWTSLNIQSEEMDQNSAEEIYDEYEITLVSQSKEFRDKKIGQIISELNDITTGDEHASDFENWCKKVIELIFAGQLTNIQTRPNNNAALRRDIVGTNEGIDGFWKRILQDYGTRQIVFEVKNYEKLTVNEYRQVYSYLEREYGNFAFIICRDKQKELTKGAELDAFRDFYGKNKVIVKLTASFLVNLLHKIRSPQKFDAAEDAFKKHLDEHIRLFANGQRAPKKKDSSVDRF